MGKMKRILCVSMAVVLAMGFCLSSVIFTSAELILDKGDFIWTKMVHDDDVFMHFSPSGLDMWEDVPFTYTATGAKNFYINETVVEQVFPLHGRSNKYDIRVGFDVELGLDLPDDASASAISCGLALTGFDSNMYYDKDLFDTHSVTMWVNDTYKYDITSSVVTTKETTPDGWWRCYIDFYALLEVDVPKHDIDRVTIFWDSGYFVDGIYDLHPFDYSLDLDNNNYPFIAVSGSVPFSSYDDVIGKFDDLQNVIVGDPSDYEDVGADVESSSSDLINDASNAFDAMEDFDKSWQDSVQEIYNSLPTAKDPIGSLQGGLVIDSADGTIISRLWSLFEEYKEISIFFTSGLLIVCVYFFLRR